MSPIIEFIAISDPQCSILTFTLIKWRDNRYLRIQPKLAAKMAEQLFFANGSYDEIVSNAYDKLNA